MLALGATLLSLVLVGAAPRAVPEAGASADESLGLVQFPISCNAAAQARFNVAVALLHHMTYPQARAAFRDTAELDPGCAMAHWGVAMTLFQPLWPTRPSAEDLRRGREEAERARTLAAPTERERAFVAAVAAFFADPESTDYWQRMRRWEAGMQEVHAAFPQDPEASAFYALSLLASATSGPEALEHSRRAADLLLPIYQANPSHPGAMHYLVHADDVAGREHDHLAIVQRYEEVAPDNPHALHMPTHIYTRLGDWDGVIRGNLKAAEAALRHPAGEHGELVWDEFPHAIEYLVYGYLQQGADERAAAQIARLQSTARLEPTAKTAFHLASTRARFALERHAWAEAAAIVPRESDAVPWDSFPWAEAVSWFARGLGAAHTGAAEEARRAVERLRALEDAAQRSGEDAFALQIRLLRLELQAWRAHVANDPTALPLLQEAVALEAATPKPPVTPAPTVPALELLGDFDLERALPGEALASYSRSLELYPRRLNGLLGAARAAHAAGQHEQAARFYEQLLEVASQGTRPGVLVEARRYASEHAATR